MNRTPHRSRASAPFVFSRPILSGHGFESLEGRRLCSHAPTILTAFKQTNLVSDGAVKAAHTDPLLKNPWGLAFNTDFDVAWTGNNGSGTSSVYDDTGAISTNPVTIPPGTATRGDGTPTGEIFNTGNGFAISKGSASAPAAYVWSTEDGTISAWNPSVDATDAIKVVDNSASHAVYKGLAVASRKSKQFIYATDFHNNKIDVFDSAFHPVTAKGGFVDAKLPKHFAPFGIQNIGGDLYVTYAKQNTARHDDVAGSGKGIVDVFSDTGELVRRFAGGGTLNSPWGITQAPKGFGAVAGDILVGNFGDGKISAFNPTSGKLAGYLGGTSGKAIVLDGLWGLSFGPTATDAKKLFFTAGPNGETNGLYGSLAVGKLTAKAASPTPTPTSTPIYG